MQARRLIATCFAFLLLTAALLAHPAPPPSTAESAAALLDPQHGNLGMSSASGSAAPPRRSIIWLHGLGDSGRGWSWLPSALGKKKELPDCAWAFPDAPMRHVTLAGAAMRAWFDLDALPVTSGTPASAADFAAGLATVHALIDKEVARGVPPERIVVGGFSQGGALALYAGLRYPQPLGGIVSFSGWLPLFDPANAPALAASRVLLVHGTRDGKVRFGLAESAADALRPRVKSLRFESFKGDHEAPPLEWLEEFLREV